MSEAGVIAYNPRGWAYETGRTSRSRNLVIRVRGTLKTSSHDALENIDPTNPGKSWSQEELNVSMASSAKLFIVVGEYLPQGPGLNPTSTTVISPQQNALVLVARVAAKVDNFYVLINKVNGLCMAQKLPDWSKGTGLRAFFYDDFIDDLSSPRTQYQKRYIAWSAVLTTVRKEWYTENEHKLSDHPSFLGNIDETRKMDSHECHTWSAYESLTLFAATSDRSLLHQSKELIIKARKTLSNTTPRDTDEESLQGHLYQLFNRPEEFSLDEAEELIPLLEEHFKQHEMAIEPSLDTSTIVEFADGLQFLGDHTITSDVYEELLVTFCYLRSIKWLRGAGARETVRIAFGLTVQRPRHRTIPKDVHLEGGVSDKVLLKFLVLKDKRFEAFVNLLSDVMDAHDKGFEHMNAPRGGRDLASLGDLAGNTLDYAMKTEALVQWEHRAHLANRGHLHLIREIAKKMRSVLRDQTALLRMRYGDTSDDLDDHEEGSEEESGEELEAGSEQDMEEGLGEDIDASLTVSTMDSSTTNHSTSLTNIELDSPVDSSEAAYIEPGTISHASTDGNARAASHPHHSAHDDPLSYRHEEDASNAMSINAPQQAAVPDSSHLTEPSREDTSDALPASLNAPQEAVVPDSGLLTEPCREDTSDALPEPLTAMSGNEHPDNEAFDVTTSPHSQPQVSCDSIHRDNDTGEATTVADRYHNTSPGTPHVEPAPPMSLSHTPNESQSVQDDATPTSCSNDNEELESHDRAKSSSLFPEQDKNDEMDDTPKSPLFPEEDDDEMDDALKSSSGSSPDKDLDNDNGVGTYTTKRKKPPSMGGGPPTKKRKPFSHTRTRSMQQHEEDPEVDTSDDSELKAMRLKRDQINYDYQRLKAQREKKNEGSKNTGNKKAKTATMSKGAKQPKTTKSKRNALFQKQLEANSKAKKAMKAMQLFASQAKEVKKTKK